MTALGTESTAPSAAFASDTTAGVHPRVLTALIDANQGFAIPYGADRWTRAATVALRAAVGAPEAEVLFTASGTGANIIALSAVLEHELGVVCADTAHINVDESSAPERFAGIKLIPSETSDGKLRPESVERALSARRPFGPRGRILTITQATELGTVYSVDELRALADLARERHLIVHIDGARLANAAAALDVSLSSLVRHTGADVLTFGGAKSGLGIGEAVVFVRPDLAPGARYIQKQAMHLLPKMRFLGAQFEALLADDLWLHNARHANAMAARLAQHLADVPAVEIAYPVQTNMVFARLPEAAIEKLQHRYAFFRAPAEPSLARWVTSWATAPEEVDAFATTVAQCVARTA